MLDDTKNSKIIDEVIPQLCSYMTMKNILRIKNQKLDDALKDEERQKRKAILMAETGMTFDEHQDEPIHEEEEKKGGKKGKKQKVEEIDPEELERRKKIA